jgi:hypothetical protein
MQARDPQLPDASDRRSTGWNGRAGGFDEELPRAYGHTRLVLLAVDPFHIHAYWEMTLEDRVEARERIEALGEGDLEWVLRFYDVTYIEYDGKNAHGFFDVRICASARNWYVELWSAEKTYFAELGLRRGAEFVPVCRSNFAHVPRADPPPRAADSPLSEVTVLTAVEPPAPAPAPAPASPGVSGEEYARWLREQLGATRPDVEPEARAQPDASDVPRQPTEIESATSSAAGGTSAVESAVETTEQSLASAAAPSRSVSLRDFWGSGSSGERPGAPLGGSGSSA